MRKIIRALLLVLLFINLLYVTSGVLHYFLRSVDVYAIWMYKAKLFFVNDWEIFGSLRNIPHGHPQYPILLPLFFSFIYILAGGVSEIYVLSLYPLLYVGLLYLIYKLLREFDVGKTSSLFFVYIYSMFGPLLAQAGRNHAGSADIWIVFINWIIVYLAYKYVKDKADSKILIMIAVLVGISSQIKMEGVFYATILLFLTAKKKQKALSVSLAILPTILWFYLRKTHGLAPSFSFYLPGIGLLVSRTMNVFKFAVLEMLNLNNWYIFWPIFLISLFSFELKNRYIIKVIIPTLVLSSLAYLFVYLFSTIDVFRYVPSSIDRVLFQLSPFYYLIFAKSFFRTTKTE